jgi:hypothetical protein
MKFTEKFSLVINLATGSQTAALAEAGKLENPLERMFVLGSIYNQICTDHKLNDRIIQAMWEELI